MKVAKFKVNNLYPPYQGKGKAKIKANDGGSYSCEESQLSQFREGEDVAIYYTDESFKDKTTGKLVTFKKFHSKIIDAGAPQQKNFTRPRMDDSDARGSAITATLCAYVTKGAVPLERTAIARAREEIGAGYDMSHNPQRADDMNDQIPDFPSKGEELENTF